MLDVSLPAPSGPRRPIVGGAPDGRAQLIDTSGTRAGCYGPRRPQDTVLYRVVAELGFSLHAATTADDDERGREALVRYVLLGTDGEPPIAQDRGKLLDGGLVRIELRRPFGDGIVAVDMDPLSLLCRLAAAVPPPRFNTVLRYAGVLAPASRWRPLVVPPSPTIGPGSEQTEEAVAAPVRLHRDAIETCHPPLWVAAMD